MKRMRAESRSILRSCRAGLCAWVSAGLAACAQVPPSAPSQPTPAPPATKNESPPPKLRGIKPAELPREEPGVGVGGLTHEAGPPAK